MNFDFSTEIRFRSLEKIENTIYSGYYCEWGPILFKQKHK